MKVERKSGIGINLKLDKNSNGMQLGLVHMVLPTIRTINTSTILTQSISTINN